MLFMRQREHRRADPNNPQPGYYIFSLVPKGWAVPAHVTIANNVIQVTVNGSQVIDCWSVTDLPDLFVEAVAEGRLFEHPLFRIVLFGEPCDETEYRYRLSLRDWAVNNAPDHPCLHPERPIDLRTLPATDF